MLKTLITSSKFIDFIYMGRWIHVIKFVFITHECDSIIQQKKTYKLTYIYFKKNVFVFVVYLCDENWKISGYVKSECAMSGRTIIRPRKLMSNLKKVSIKRSMINAVWPSSKLRCIVGCIHHWIRTHSPCRLSWGISLSGDIIDNNFLLDCEADERV